MALVTPLANATLSAASSATFGPFGRDDENAGSPRQVWKRSTRSTRVRRITAPTLRGRARDHVASALADARRVLILATDRIYQALLARPGNEAGATAPPRPHTVAGLRIWEATVDRADALAGVADTDAGTDADQPQEAAQLQRQDVARTFTAQRALGDADADADAAARQTSACSCSRPWWRTRCSGCQ